ncbi:MAG TPA: ABC transporter substrate-binding protein [bacterium]|nr:ABC transporter substrate-binding protein [bacterium]
MNGGVQIVPGFFLRSAYLALLVLCLFSSCSKSAASGSALVVAIPAAPLTLDPRLASDAEGDKIGSLICEGLVRFDENLDIVPGLAEKIDRLSDTSYRFRLRPGVLFHDGTPLTADDVVYTFRSIVSGKIASPYKGSYEWIDRVEAESPLVVRIDMKEPYGPFMSRLTRGIVSKKVAMERGKLFGRAPVCAGPYRFVRFAPDSSVELEANSNYYGKKPKTEGLTFRVVKDNNVRVLKLIKGDVDLVQNAVPPMLIDKLLENPELKKSAGAGIVMAYMGMNLTDPVLSDPRVRRAIAYAIDRDAIIAHRWKGLASKANSVLSPRNWAYARGLGQYDHDPERAKRLLDEAGYRDPDGDGPGARFRLTLKTSTARDRIDIARMLAGQKGGRHRCAGGALRVGDVLPRRAPRQLPDIHPLLGRRDRARHLLRDRPLVSVSTEGAQPRAIQKRRGRPAGHGGPLYGRRKEKAGDIRKGAEDTVRRAAVHTALVRGQRDPVQKGAIECEAQAGRLLQGLRGYGKALRNGWGLCSDSAAVLFGAKT